MVTSSARENMAKVIAFMGYRRSGKTESSKIVSEIGLEYGLDIKRMSFATPLKELFADYKGIKIDALYKDFTKETYREEIQRYGDAILETDPFFFADKLFKQVNPSDYVAIDDTRKIEELQRIKEHEGVPVYIYADRLTRQARGAKFDPIIDNHISETELGDLCQETILTLGGYYVYNNGSIDNLKYQLQGIFKKVILPRYD